MHKVQKIILHIINNKIYQIRAIGFNKIKPYAVYESTNNPVKWVWGHWGFDWSGYDIQDWFYIE